MLTKLVVENFKRFKRAEIELGEAVVLIGPNNSGKTSALQALALWQLGVRKWNERREGKATPEKRPGVTINRKDLVSLPVPTANHLWSDLHVRDVSRVEGKSKTKNIRVNITVEGVDCNRAWTCGMEFDYANEESLYCRPLRRMGATGLEMMPVPGAAGAVSVSFLPPMSGLAANETRLDAGAVLVRIGEGRTAEVLRNLCFKLSEDESERGWLEVVREIDGLFGVTLERPRYIAERGEIEMSYRERAGVRLDLSAAGRGLHQTLLLLAYLAANPGSVLLLDEPDAHLEILRQRQIYGLITAVAREKGSQVIAASHSEVVLNEAANRDVVVAFVGTPHRVDDRGAQVRKALQEIGFEAFYQAELNGWVMYLEGSTDLAILQTFARLLKHPVAGALEKAFVHYVTNRPTQARDHFFGVRDSKDDLVGFALFDRLEGESLRERPPLTEIMWKRYEIENYLFTPAVLRRFARSAAHEQAAGPLFEEDQVAQSERAMEECLGGLIPPLALGNLNDPYWQDEKASAVLDRLFELYFKKLDLPNLMRKSDYHVLASLLRPEEIPPEVGAVLDRLKAVIDTARPRS